MKLGITGYPLTYTQSPRLHRAFLREAGLKGSYEVRPFDPRGGKRAFFGFLDSLAAVGFVGLNVTVPHKEWAFEYGARLGRGCVDGVHGASAKLVRAANTIVFEARGARVANTDSDGLWSDVDEWLEAVDRDVLIVGTGGSARGALAGVLARHPAAKRVVSVRVWGRDKTKAAKLQKLAGRAKARSEELLVLWCLPPMSSEEARDVWMRALDESEHKRVYLYDLNYGERADATIGLVPARRRRSGLGMLKKQARASFNLWAKAR